METVQNIMVVDDQKVNLDLLSLILEKLGYNSILASDGFEALEKAGSNEVSLVFMDIQMPKMDGYEASRNLRTRGFKKPIIAITATDSKDVYENCLKAGMDGLLIKPIKRIDIEKTLQKWINAGAKATPAEIPAKSAGNSVFDPDDVLDTFMGNKTAVLSLIAHFIERTREQLKLFPALEKAADWGSASREAHTIKGSAFTMGAKELGKAAAILEQVYKDVNKDEMKTALSRVYRAFGSYKKIAEEYIQRN